ncbi:MAG: hypothetical protein P8178_06330 [Candidatus Thiodiazotropha sp.]
MTRQATNDTLAHRVKEAFIRAAIWAFIGLLYAMLFIFFSALSEYWQLPVDPQFLAGILAGTIGALIYSSMRLAVLMTVIVSPLSIFYFILVDWPVDLVRLLLIVCLVGAVIGALYGVFSMGSRIYRADAKTLAGFCAGWISSLVYLLSSTLVGPVSLGTIVAVMCPLTGLLYVWMVPTFIKHYDNLLPPVADGLLVGVGVSGFVALTFFVMIASIDNSVAGPMLPVIDKMQGNLAPAVLGGVIGGGLAGAVSGLLVTGWQDL